MTFTRTLTSDAERKSVARQAYLRSLNGEDDTTIAEALSVDEWQIKSLREWWAANFVATPAQEEARKTALARAEGDLAYLAEIQQEIKNQYENEQIDVRDYARFGTMVVKTKTDIGARYAKLLDLDSALKINVTSHTKLDEEILELSRQFGAQEEADLPLD